MSHHIGQTALFDFRNESPKSSRLCHLPPHHLQRDVQATMLNGIFFHLIDDVHTYVRYGKWSLLTFRPRSEPASRGTADLLLSVMRPIRWSPSLDGCHETGCCRDKEKQEVMRVAVNKEGSRFSTLL